MSKAIADLRRTAERLILINPDLTARSLLLLCVVAEDEGKTVSEYARAAGLPLSTTSRLLLDLSETSRSARRLTGAGLLERRRAASLREVLYSVSTRGRSVLQLFEARTPKAAA